MAINLRRSLRGAPVNAPKPPKPRAPQRRTTKRGTLAVTTRNLGDREHKILTFDGRAVRDLLPNTMAVRYRYGILRAFFFEADEHNHIANLRALRIVASDIMRSLEAGDIREYAVAYRDFQHLVREIQESRREIAAAQNEGKRGERAYVPANPNELCDIPADEYAVPDEEEARTALPEEETPAQRVEDFVPGTWRVYPDNLVNYAMEALRLHLEGGSSEDPRIMALFRALHGTDAITIPEHQRMAVQFHSLLAAIRARR